MSFLIKASLPTVAQEYYRNTKDNSRETITATNIRMCNTSGSAVTVYLSFYNSADSLEYFETGAVLYAYSLAANAVLDIPDRIIQLDDTVEAYAGTADVVSLSMDIIGDSGRFQISV